MISPRQHSKQTLRYCCVSLCKDDLTQTVTQTTLGAEVGTWSGEVGKATTSKANSTKCVRKRPLKNTAKARKYGLYRHISTSKEII